MKLGSLRAGGRDGTLVVVDRALSRAVTVPTVAATLQAALDTWADCESRLKAVYDELNRGAVASTSFPLEIASLAAPLPRAYQWLDGSAYLSHIERVRRARGADLPEALRTDPLMYQGVSDPFLGPQEVMVEGNADQGIDFEAELAAVTDDVALGTGRGDAAGHVKLLMIVNDISLRRVIPAELAKGFGFVHGKPPSACSPVAVTPDELGLAWHEGKICLRLRSHLNHELFGQPDAGLDMQFSFPTLISHAARTRRLGAGTIIGSGTVSNYDSACGYSCIMERRLVEKIETGRSVTPFMTAGDSVRIEMLDEAGQSIFGAIEQTVVASSGRPS